MTKNVYERTNRRTDVTNAETISIRTVTVRSGDNEPFGLSGTTLTHTRTRGRVKNTEEIRRDSKLAFDSRRPALGSVQSVPSGNYYRTMRRWQ